MAEPDHPDRDQGPAYWSAIRRGVWVVVVLAVVLFVTGLLDIAVREHGWRVGLVAVIGVVVVAAAQLLIDRLAAPREDRS